MHFAEHTCISGGRHLAHHIDERTAVELTLVCLMLTFRIILLLSVCLFLFLSLFFHIDQIDYILFLFPPFSIFVFYVFHRLLS